MKTIRLTIDEDLLRNDNLTQELKTTRSAFVRKALEESVTNYETERLEAKHEKGYRKHPVMRDEFSVCEKERAWGDE